MGWRDCEELLNFMLSGNGGVEDDKETDNIRMEK